MALGFWRGFLAGGVVGALVGSISRYRTEPVVNQPAEVRAPVRPRGVIRRRHP